LPPLSCAEIRPPFPLIIWWFFSRHFSISSRRSHNFGNLRVIFFWGTFN